MTTLAATLERIRPRRLRLPRSWSARISLAVLLLVAGIAFVGPYLAPYSPSDPVGIPFSGPSAEFPFGTDFLGRDMLSRVLWGGRILLVLATLSVVLSYLVGVPLGLVAAYGRSFLDAVIMRGIDLLLAFPGLVLLLLLAAAAGPGEATIVVSVAIFNIPGIARVIRAAALEVTVRGFVEAAVARGERLPYLLGREILPNITSTVLADAGLRVVGALFAVAGLNFLGLGLRPPDADWAMLIGENREAFTLQPWAVVAPAVLIALLTLSANTLADAIARSLGKSTTEVG